MILNETECLAADDNHKCFESVVSLGTERGHWQLMLSLSYLFICKIHRGSVQEATVQAMLAPSNPGVSKAIAAVLRIQNALFPGLLAHTPHSDKSGS